MYYTQLCQYTMHPLLVLGKLPCFLHALELLHLILVDCFCFVAKYHVQVFYNPMDYSSTRLLCPWDFPDKNTGVGCHGLLQGILLTQGLNPRFLHLLFSRQILHH